MAFTPDLPFPKSPGDSIRSKDWNDLVSETKRLDTAKVERAGDAITGNLSIAGALAIGKAAATAPAKLDVAGDVGLNDHTVWLRGANDANHGLAWRGAPNTFAGTAFDGPVLWGNNGGALGSHSGAVEVIALTWDNGGRVAVGVPSTELKFDVGGRIRLRQMNESSAGLWLNQRVPNADRAFIGMASDDLVGFYGAGFGNWGLTMNVNTGDLNVRRNIVSPRFKCTNVMYYRAGPLPLNATFTSSGGTLVFFATGSGYRTTAAGAGAIGMVMQIDGGSFSATQSFSNEVLSHKVFSPLFYTQGFVAAGSHTLTLAANVNTTTDLSDLFSVTVLELPF